VETNDKLYLDAIYFQYQCNNRVIDRISLKYRLKFSKSSYKLVELFEVLKGKRTHAKFKYTELAKVSEDIGVVGVAVPYLLRDQVLALTAEGKAAFYLGIFNLSKSAVKLYIDVSIIRGLEDGVVTEIFSDMNYLISEGKIYVRKLAAMECMLFAKHK
jgi:hypothetical protein